MTRPEDERPTPADIVDELTTEELPLRGKLTPRFVTDPVMRRNSPYTEDQQEPVFIPKTKEQEARESEKRPEGPWVWTAAAIVSFAIAFLCAWLTWPHDEPVRVAAALLTVGMFVGSAGYCVLNAQRAFRRRSRIGA